MRKKKSMFNMDPPKLKFSLKKALGLKKEDEPDDEIDLRDPTPPPAPPPEEKKEEAPAAWNSQPRHHLRTKSGRRSTRAANSELRRKLG